jgi:hypothetical protein
MEFPSRRQFENLFEMELKRRHEFWTISTGDLAFLLLVFFILIVTIARIWRVEGVEVKEKDPVLIFKQVIMFKEGSDELLPEEERKIDKIIRELQALPPGFKVIISCINSKEEGFDRDLSYRRIRKVEEYMIQKGIWQGRLEISAAPEISKEKPYIQIRVEMR